MKNLTAPQAALLAKLPAEFVVVEDFRASNCPGTVIQDMSGREVFRLTTGEPRAFKSLWRADRVVDVEKRHEGLLHRTVFMKA